MKKISGVIGLLKILQAIDGRTWGGAEAVVASLASGLAEKGHQVTVWTSKKGGCKKIFKERFKDKVVVSEVPLLNDGDLVSMMYFYTAFKKFDIIHVHSSYATILSGRSALFVPRQTRRKIVCHFHRPVGNPKHYKNHFQGICVSKTVEKFVKTNLPWIHTWCVHNGIEIEASNGNQPLLESSDKIRIGYLARLSEKKGHEDLLKAFAKFDPKREVELVLGGEGKRLPFLKQLAQDLGVAERVRFLGFVPPELAFSFWKSMDIACFPTYTEGFGISLLEAMASNLAIVAYDDPALEETLKDEGIVVPTGDIDGLYSALETLAFNPDVRSHYSACAAARSRIFTKDHMVEHIIHVYEEMLTGQ